MRRALTTLFVVSVLISGVAPAVSAGAAHSVGTGPAAGSSSAPTASAVASAAASTAATSAPADPESDRLGWENGYWYNESIDVDQSDGVSDEELTAVVSRAMARVEHIRQLEFKETVPVDIISREEFRESSSNTTVNETFRTFDDTKFEALLLIGESDDALDVQEANRGSSVLGYYSPSQDQIVLIANNKSAPKLDEYTLAHELVHALQDQHFDLTSISSETRDGHNANNGIVEGDAKYVDYLYKQRCTDPDHAWNGTCVTPPASEGGGGGSPANFGVYFMKFQPYSDGPKFVSSVRANGGWAAVNDVYTNLPASTEQVIDPSRYRSDEPTAVELEDELGDGWERVTPPNRPNYASVGQAGVASMFVYPLYDGGERIVQPQEWLNYTGQNQISSFDPLNYGFPLAEGWDGDRMHFYQNEDGEIGYVWRLVWDSERDAAEFREGYVKVLNYWGAEQVGPNTYRIPEGAEGGFADAFHLVVEGDTVTIVNAPTVDQLNEVRTSVEVSADDQSTPEPTDGGVSPTATDETDSEGTTSTTSPGFAVSAAVLALLGVALLFGRR